MCDSTGDIEDFNAVFSKQALKTKNGLANKCKKCEGKATLLLQKKDPFCRSCFFEYCNHKFRATIGKTKKVKHGDKVLLACSGGRKSIAMLHMTKKTLDTATGKQISFIPYILYVDESVISPFFTEKMEIENDKIVQLLKEYGYPTYITCLEMICKLNCNQEFYWNCNPCKFSKLSPCSDAQSWFQECLKDMSLSEKYDLVKYLRLRLITEIACHLGCNHVFVGDSGESLAVDLLTDICLGRGSQISSDTNFCDFRFKVPVCRPIREFLNKELLLYNHLHNCMYYIIPDLLTMTKSTSCIQRLTEFFISDLQESFPATVFTIFRTGSKLFLENSEFSHEACILCKSKLDNMNPDSCSAIEALKVSKELSVNNSCPDLDIALDFKNLDLSTQLCYSCSRLFENKKCMKNYVLLQKNLIEILRMQNVKENTLSVTNIDSFS